MFRRTKIPETFYAFETQQPFTHCIECGVDLVSLTTPYFVEKAFRKYPGYKAHDVVYEFAMCLDCANSMRKQLSKDSLKAMESYMQDYLLSRTEEPVENGLETCLVTKKPIDKEEEYIIYGVFQGNEMMVADFPYAIGKDAMDQLSDLLSNQTLDFMNDFSGKHFMGPPEVNEILGPRRPVLF